MNYISFLLVGLIFFFSCSNDSLKSDRLLQHRADSLFLLEEQIIKNKMDSICLEFKFSNKQKLLDSIVEVRKLEIIQLQKGL